jgi:hypothetical protein
MICMCVLVYSFFDKNPSIRSWLTTRLSECGCCTWYQSNVKVKCKLLNLKNDQQRFYGDEHNLPI